MCPQKPAERAKLPGYPPFLGGQFLACYGHLLAYEGALSARSELQSLDEVIQVTSPGGDPLLQGYLRRPSLKKVPAVQVLVPEELLVRKLLNFVSIKGEDLLIQADSENQVKFHRLPASVPSRLWNWKTICGWPWKTKGFHINVLEVHAVYTCLRWRISRKRQMHCRFLHLTDSLVALHALSRGRSSSRKLRSVLSNCGRRVASVGLCVHQAESCRPVWKGCLKPKHT